MKWTNYHQHSHYDDGKETVEKHVISAIEHGVKSMGFSGHCPLPFDNNWAMKHEDIDQYLEDIQSAKLKYQHQLEVYKSLEIDYIPEILGPADSWIKNLKLDYTIGSVHFAGQYEDGSHGEVDGTHSRFTHALDKIYHNDIKAFVSDYFRLTREMIKTTAPDIVGHMDKVKMQNNALWDEGSDWYRTEVFSTLEEIKSANAIVEVNTRGLYKKKVTDTYPATWILSEIQKMKIPIHINSDAHVPTEVTKNFKETLQLLQSLDFQNVKILHQSNWILADISKNELRW